MSEWGGRTADNLYGYVSTNMPDDAPGSLKASEYAAVVAYMFQLNNFPTGATPLPADLDALEQIRIQSGR